MLLLYTVLPRCIAPGYKIGYDANPAFCQVKG